MTELFFATKKEEKTTYPTGTLNIVKFVENRTGAALAIAEGWRVYKLDAIECFAPDIQFSDKAPSPDEEFAEKKVRKPRVKTGA